MPLAHLGDLGLEQGALRLGETLGGENVETCCWFSPTKDADRRHRKVGGMAEEKCGDWQEHEQQIGP